VVGALYKDQVVQGDEINSDWVHVTAPDGKVGWSHRGFLELIERTPPPPTGDVFCVGATTLNLRQGPGTNYAIGTLKKARPWKGWRFTGWTLGGSARRLEPPAGASLEIYDQDHCRPAAELHGYLDDRHDRYVEYPFRPGHGYSIIRQAHRSEKVTYLGALRHGTGSTSRLDIIRLVFGALS
jgi:hypothetical protein